MEAVIFDGKEYLKASVVAERFNYTQDYIGQLCRGKKVDARLVGRAWYINLDSLNSHKKTRYKAVEKKLDTSAEKSIPQTVPARASKEHYLSRIDVEPVLKKKTVKILKTVGANLTEVPVKYENDDYSLIPRISREAISKEVPILPAGAEDLSIKSTKESVRITNFKAEPLPEVYLKGVLRVDGLPEALEELQETTNEPAKTLSIEPVSTAVSSDTLPKKDRIVANGNQSAEKKPIKIKLYRNDPRRIVPSAPMRNDLTRTKMETIKTVQKRPLPPAKTPVQMPSRPAVTPMSLKKQNITPAPIAAPKKNTVIPHASLKAITITLVGCVVAAGLLLPKEIISIADRSSSSQWEISLESPRAALDLLIAQE